MNYRVRRLGDDLGVFSFEDLRRRRAAGELTGSEHVQAEGMADWQPLDLVLQQGDSSAPPPMMAPASIAGVGKFAIGLLVAAAAILAVGALVYFRRPAPPTPAKPTLAALEPGMAVANKPVSWNANSPIERDIGKRGREFRLRQWLDGYQKRGHHDPAVDAEAEQFIRAFIANGHGGPGAPKQVALEEECERLARNPACTDPLVLTLAADKSLNNYDRVHRFEAALAAYPGSTHLAYPRLYATVKLLGQLQNRADQSEELNTSALALLPQCFSDGSLTPADQQEIAEIFVHGWASGFFAANDAPVCEIVHNAGPSYQWLALVLDGDRYITEAWKERGSGYSNTVTSDGWLAFGKDLADARRILIQAWKLQPAFPIAPCLMITVCLGDSNIDEMRTWFDRTVAVQMDYPGAWSSLRWGLRPRWYGSEAAVLALGMAAINTGRFDTDVPRTFFDSVSDVESDSELPAGRHIYGRADIWPQFQRMYQGYIAEPVEAHDRNGWRTSYAVVSFFAGKYDVARQQLEALDWKPAPGHLSSWGVDLSSMPLEVAARTGSLGAQVSAAEAARASGDVSAALKQYSDLGSAAADARSGEFIRRRVATLGIEQRLRKGEWVELMPSGDQDPDWTYSFGKAHRLADGALEVQYGPKGHMLFSNVPMGSSFEVRGSFENVRSSDRNFQAGIVMGVPDFGRYNWYGFRLKRHDEEGDVVCFGLGWSTERLDQHVVLNDVTNSFDLIFQNGRATVSVNGDEIFHQAAPTRSIRVPNNSYLVGLGAFSDSADAVIRYHDVRVRQLH
jgi:hypothetical protein